MNIQERLFSLRDADFATFQAKLIPTVDCGSIIGVRTPQLRKIAGELVESGEHKTFLSELPHKYFEENQLHSIIISRERNIDDAFFYTSVFVPYIDNWATCDTLSPAVFAKNRAKLRGMIDALLMGADTYSVRFAVSMIMRHFLDGDDFMPFYLRKVAEIESDEYYVNMMRAWFFATALAKQYDETVIVLKNGILDTWTHNMTIRKACESHRISPEVKEYLKTLKKQ